MMKKPVLILIVMIIIGLSTAYASGVSGLTAEQARERVRDVLQKLTPKTPENLPDNANANVRLPYDFSTQEVIGEVDPIAISERYRLQQKAKKNIGNDNEINIEKAELIAFVSFSMPEVSLRRIALDMRRTGGVIVLNGFKNNSMKATQVASRIMTELDASVIIQPQLFDKFDIKAVPQFVLTRPVSLKTEGDCEEAQCQSLSFIKVQGDVSLQAALERIIQLANQENNKELVKSGNARLKRWKESWK